MIKKNFSGFFFRRKFWACKLIYYFPVVIHNIYNLRIFAVIVLRILTMHANSHSRPYEHAVINNNTVDGHNATVLCGFNDWGCLNTLIFHSMARFLFRFSTFSTKKKENKNREIYQLEL